MSLEGSGVSCGRLFVTRPSESSLTFAKNGLVVGIGWPNDQRLTCPATPASGYDLISPGFATVKRHASEAVRFGADPRFHVMVKALPGSSDSPEIGRTAISRRRFEWLEGEFQASIDGQRAGESCRRRCTRDERQS